MLTGNYKVFKAQFNKFIVDNYHQTATIALHCFNIEREGEEREGGRGERGRERRERERRERKREGGEGGREEGGREGEGGGRTRYKHTMW